MFKTRRFIFVHMPRSGGTWVRDLLLRTFGDQERDAKTYIATHATAAQIVPADREGRLVWGVIRNPWDWYLSVYQYAVSRAEEVDRIRTYGRGSLEFRDVVWGMTHPAEEHTPQPLSVIWEMYLDQKKRPKGRAAFIESGVGLWSWVAMHIYGRDPFGHMVSAFVDTDRLYDGVLELTGIEAKPAGFPPVNTAAQFAAIPNPRSMYDKESIRWVAEADGALMREIGYHPGQPFEPHPQTVIRL